ncbi:oxidoreductase [Paractinoplanes rishiriensis]|uniref:Oxidoreductase n=1 Tax=Paractinoplanes rishiriensis TaxID=1050105 RepID=A0A919K8M7_9ACTN|nr:oxidoreductase [Actinoplanes rishiriensis]
MIGVGYWGAKQLRVMRGTPGVSSVVAVDARIEHLPDLAHLVAEGRGFTSLQAALPHVDAFVIATPPATHAHLGLQAIEAGKHVLIEKPLATTTADALLLIAAAREAGVTLMVGHTFEYNAAVWMLRDLVQSRELGDLYHLTSSRLNMGLYQSDVNVVFDLAPHDVSIANHVLGQAPSSVTAWGSHHVDPTFEDVAFLRLDYADLGAHATIHVSWLDPVKTRRITAVGSKKMAVYDDTAEERIRIHDKAVLLPDAGSPARKQYHQGAITSPPIAFDEPLAVQARHFVDCAVTGATPRTDGANGLAVVQVIEAAQLSLAEERRVQLDEILTRSLPHSVAALIPTPVPSQRNGKVLRTFAS